MAWDAEILGVRVARVSDVVHVPSSSEMDAYDLIVAKLPMEWTEGREIYQRAGFEFVNLDFNMSAQPLAAENGTNSLPLVWLSKTKPSFVINGFHIEDSRMMLDSSCRARLPNRFWDKVIEEHCASYADGVACVLSRDNKHLVGLISCFGDQSSLDLFLIAVHPEYQSLGVGNQLMAFVGNKALTDGLSLKTQVLATNTRAMNFYSKWGFRIDSGDLVMHRWRKEVCK
jgi:GNAT superfamily N-acetyltransferase